MNSLPTDAQDRKDIPLFWGLVNYFRDALIAVAKLSMIGNAQHNPGEPLRWNREKGGDELDAQMRHMFEIGGIDWQKVPHSVRNAWRALATCQIELEITPWTTPVAEIVALIREQKEKDAQFDASVEGLGPPISLVKTPVIPERAQYIMRPLRGICAPAPTPHQEIVALQHVTTTQGPSQIPVVRIKAFGPFPNMKDANYFAKSLRANNPSAPVSFVTLADVSKLRTKKC
jgi:hypothetical protein